MNSFTRAVNAESDKPKNSRGSSRSCCHKLHQSVLHFFYQLITNLFAISAHACACFSREHCDLTSFNALSSKNLIAYMRLLLPECAELLRSRISSVTCAVRVTCAAVLTAPCGYILCSFGLVLNIPRLADRPIPHDLTVSIICNATAITRSSRCNLYILSSLKTIL